MYKPSLFFALFLFTTVWIKPGYADQTVLTTDGREVQLNSDGSWKYLSTDRFVDTSDGRRVRLKQDGSWTYVGNAPLSARDQVRTTDIDIKLERVVVETYKKKSNKSSLIKTQTVFYVRIENATQASKSLRLGDASLKHIKVQDNNGKDYPVVAIEPETAVIEPGSALTLIVRAAKSPSIFDDVNSMQINFGTGLFGFDDRVELSQRTIDFEEQNVDRFEH